MIVGSTRRDLAVGRGELQDVDFADSLPTGVAEPAVAARAGAARAGAREAVREPQLLVVPQEERLAVAVVRPGNDDRAADARAVLIQLDLVLRQVVELVEPVVGVQLGWREVLVAVPLNRLVPERVVKLMLMAPLPPTSRRRPRSRR